MRVTDQYITNDAIYRLLENGDNDASMTLLTNMFSLQEIIDSINRIQQQFLLETGLIVTRTTIPAVIGQAIYDLPPTPSVPAVLRGRRWNLNSCPSISFNP